MWDCRWTDCNQKEHMPCGCALDPARVMACFLVACTASPRSKDFELHALEVPESPPSCRGPTTTSSIYLFLSRGETKPAIPNYCCGKASPAL